MVRRSPRTPYYINGLNVTDFYNRNAFSEAPFNFYQEFQVKTGGYSVEFGRTTGGVVNAVAKPGSNEFKAGADLTFEPRAWQSEANDRYFNGERYLTMSKDDYSQTKLDVWASGAIVKDRLFFFAMYEGRDYKPRNTDDDGETLTRGESDDGFWGGTVDWNITDNNTLSLMAFSNKDSQVGNVYDYDFDNDELGPQDQRDLHRNRRRQLGFELDFVLHQQSIDEADVRRKQRQSFTSSLNDIECNRVVKESAIPSPGVPLGCTTSSTVYNRDDNREQARADFEWSLGITCCVSASTVKSTRPNLTSAIPGRAHLLQRLPRLAGSTIPNPPGGVVPPGYSGYVRARRNEISGNFETDNSAWYIEDNWSVTDNLILEPRPAPGGVRQQGRGRTELHQDGRHDRAALWILVGHERRRHTKFFGNAGRYFLPWPT